MPAGTGICLTRGWSMPTVSTSPPNRLGEMLSTCSEPDETFSPCIANLSSSILLQRLRQQRVRRDHRRDRGGRGATETAAERNALVDRQRRNRSPDSTPAASRASARPAVFLSGSRGISVTTPVEPVMTTPGLSVRSIVTESPSTSTEKPENVEADRDVRRRGRRERRNLFVLTDAHLDTSRRAADRRTRPLP